MRRMCLSAEWDTQDSSVETQARTHRHSIKIVLYKFLSTFSPLTAFCSSSPVISKSTLQSRWIVNNIFLLSVAESVTSYCRFPLNASLMTLNVCKVKEAFCTKPCIYWMRKGLCHALAPCITLVGHKVKSEKESEQYSGFKSSVDRVSSKVLRLLATANGKKIASEHRCDVLWETNEGATLCPWGVITFWKIHWPNQAR